MSQLLHEQPNATIPAHMLSVSIAYPMAALLLSMQEDAECKRAWIAAYRGVRVRLDLRKPCGGGGHFDLYRKESAHDAAFGSVDRAEDGDVSGDVLLSAETFDRIAAAYVNKVAHELWLTLYVDNAEGWADLPLDRAAPIKRVGVALAPAAEAIL